MTQQTRVPRPDADREAVLRFYAQRDGSIVAGPCAQYDDDEGRCTGTLFVEDETLVEDSEMVRLGCDECNVLSFRTNEWVLTRARAELKDYHYRAQFEGGDGE